MTVLNEFQAILDRRDAGRITQAQAERLIDALPRAPIVFTKGMRIQTVDPARPAPAIKRPSTLTADQVETRRKKNRQQKLARKKNR